MYLRSRITLLLFLSKSILIAAFFLKVERYPDATNDVLREKWLGFTRYWEDEEFECNKRHYPGQSSFVCVCNSTFCDEIEPMNESSADHFIHGYTSTQDLYRLKHFVMAFNRDDKSNDGCGDEKNCVEFLIDTTPPKIKHKIFGFGGAFTDAAGINFESLSENSRRQALEAYFSEKGIGYTMGRVPIASCDFSTREYSYVDKAGDFQLESFALASEDLKYKIPYILNATKLSGGRLKLFASPWSAPGWMKTNERMKGGAPLKGPLNGKYYQSYANYYVKFFEEYAKRDVIFWGMTIQNEPDSGRNPNYPFQTMYLSPEMQRDFARDLLVPALRSSSASMNLKIMAHDDQRDMILDAANRIYSQPDSMIDGLGVHWYSTATYELLAQIYELQPNKFILSTEACTGSSNDSTNVRGPLLGDWNRGVAYGLDIINNLLNWVVGWMDWNMALDVQGGPNWVNNFVDAPLIVNATADEFYKQPMFYFMGHFSKFIPRGSAKLNILRSEPNEDFQTVAFRRPDGNYVMIVISLLKESYRRVVVRDSTRRYFTIVVPPQAIFTFVWKKESAKSS